MLRVLSSILVSLENDFSILVTPSMLGLSSGEECFSPLSLVIYRQQIKHDSKKLKSVLSIVGTLYIPTINCYNTI